MKTLRPYLFLVLLLLSAGISQAQTSQSAMYDAIALMNAKNGINAIFKGHPHGYDIIDPLGKNPTVANSNATPGSLRNDAATSQNIIAAILRRNAGFSATAPDDSVVAAYKDNPFLKDLFAQNAVNFVINQDAALAGLDGFATSDKSGSVAGNIGGNVVNGVADFLVQRAGEELSASVFSKLQDFIKRYPEFNILFPKTLALLKPIQPYDYAKTVVAFKAAIQEDISNLAGELPQLYRLPRYQLLNKQVPELTLVFASAELFSELHGKSSLSKSLHDLDTAGFLKAQNNYATMIHLADITSNSIRQKLITDSEDGDYPYFSLQDIGLATHNNPGYIAQLGKFYLGLLWQQLSGYEIYDQDGPHPLADLIGRYVNQAATIFNQFAASSDNLNNLGLQLATLKIRDDALAGNGQNPVSVARFTLYNKLIVSAMQLLQPFVADDKVDHPGKAQLWAICTYWPQFSASGIAMIKDVSAKNYNLAIADLSSMLKNLSAYQQGLATDAATNKQLGTVLATTLGEKVTDLNKQIKTIDSTAATLPGASSTNDPNIKAALLTQAQLLSQQKAGLNEAVSYSSDAVSLFYA